MLPTCLKTAMKANHDPASGGRQYESWRTSAWKIALIYAVVSGVWIVSSDKAVRLLLRDEEVLELAYIIKGWFFVAVTAVMLWGLIQRMLLRIEKSQAELRESEREIRALFDGVNEAVFIHDAETGEILDVNLTACRMFGYDREELRRMSVEQLSSGETPFTQEQAMELMRRGLASEPVADEWHAKHRSGRLFWAEVNARPVEIRGQTRLLVTGRDITARKRASTEIRMMSKAVEQSAASIVITDAHGVIEYANPATFRLTGYTTEELLGKKPNIFKSGKTSPYEYRKLWKTILEGHEWRGEFHNRKKGGGHYWESASISSIVDESGKITHFLAVKEDITERKLAEEKLLRQEQLLEEAGEIAHVGGWEFDPETMKGSWSAEVARIHDFEPDAEPTPELGMTVYHGESLRKIRAALDAALRNGTPYDLELEMITPKGRRKWVRTIGRPIVKDGKVVRVRGSIQDISELKQAEGELRDSRLRLRALLARIQETRENERKRLAREVHDVLGQLLTGMKMDLIWLERRFPGIADADLRATFATKLASTTALTDSMLESVQKIARDLRPSLLDNLGLTSAIQSEARQFSERTGIACDFIEQARTHDLAPDCATNVFRIFQEILTNIARHSKATRVTITLRRNEHELSLVVEDNGRGIAPDALKAPDSMGLLGMSERAEILGGRIEIGRIPAGGTRAALTVPV